MDVKMMHRSLLTVALAMGLAGSASAIDGVDVPGGVEKAAVVTNSTSVECPQLTRLKYPFITCSADAHGNVVMNTMGEPLKGERQPKGGSFVDEGDGYWGPVR